MCIYNQYIKNSKYVKNKKNGGNVPHLTDRRIEYVPIGCGNCIECRQQKAREWQVRLQQEIKRSKNGKFVTLTFSNENITKLINEQSIKKTDEKGNIKTYKLSELRGYERDNAIATKAVHLFRERWRKELTTSPRHWLVTELGHKGTENIHLHGIIWTNESIETIRKHWSYGYIWPRKETTTKTYVNAQTINYIVKYISKIDKQHKEYKPKILASNKPGIGSNYTGEENQYRGIETNETFRTSTGHKIALPIYYRNKIYTEHEKEELWIQKLNKEIRWVCGEKIDISKGEEDYKNVLQFYRRRNIELGYGGRKNENRKQYEEQRRDIMTMTRIANTKKASGGV